MEDIIRATRQDKDRMVDILSRAFKHDPHVQWFVGSGKSRARRLKTLMEFAFEKGIADQEIYLTTDKNAVAIWRNPVQAGKMTVHLLLIYVRFIWVMGITKIRAIIQLEQAIVIRYPKNQPFLYLWFLGVAPEHQGEGLSSQLLKPKLSSADKIQHSTYLETTNPVNLAIYARRGFEVYDEMVLDAQAGTTIYFMRRAHQIPVVLA
ncbi:MAG: GNAT family N-acetyltransferase [Cyclobacteriaceae bacterium]